MLIQRWRDQIATKKAACALDNTACTLSHKCIAWLQMCLKAFGLVAGGEQFIVFRQINYVPDKVQ